MTEYKQKWYPVLQPNTPRDVQDAIRRILEMIYEGNEQLGPAHVHANGTGTQTLTTDAVHVPGCQIVFPRTGRYLVVGCFTINVLGAGDQAKEFSGILDVQGKQQFPKAKLESASAGLTASVSLTWSVLAKRKDSARLLVQKETGATGNSTVDASNSSLSAIWVGVQ